MQESSSLSNQARIHWLQSSSARVQEKKSRSKRSHDALKKKLINNIAEHQYKREIAELEAKLKEYKPEVDPEDQQEWNNLYQILKNHENFVPL
jgi:ribosomal protein S12 methylthiotransferase accessory factor YcaO